MTQVNLNDNEVMSIRRELDREIKNNPVFKKT